MAKIYIGTSGYSYKDWIGPFYPEKTGEADFLPFYASQFCFVELNFSYYRMPQANLIGKIIEKTPAGFLFAIKTHKSLTHEITQDFETDVLSFRQGIAPLVETHRLAAILVQFPYSFHYTNENRTHLDRLARAFFDLPLAFEFRNDEWVKDSVITGLSERQKSFVNVDQPPLPRLIRPSAVYTGEPAYLRFHGRNQTNWWQGDNVSRYDYLYSDNELDEWLELIRQIAGKARLLLITFNNHSRGQAIQNARRLKELLAAQNLDAC